MSPISSNGTSNMSWRTKANRSAGGNGVEHDLQREADRVGQQHLVLRVELAGVLDDWIGQVHDEASSGRAFRAGLRLPAVLARANA